MLHFCSKFFWICVLRPRHSTVGWVTGMASGLSNIRAIYSHKFSLGKLGVENQRSNWLNHMENGD